MASIFSKWKRHTPFLILYVAFVFLITNSVIFTINYSKQQLQQQDEGVFQNATTYISPVKNPEWFKVVARELKDETINIGLVNMDRLKEEFHANAKIVKIHFNPVGEDIKWSDMAPERIDENSKCPYIPMPRFEDYRDLDVVVAKVSQRKHCEDGGLRDVFSVQVSLVVANLLVRSGRTDKNRPVFAVFVGSCDPMWEIFRCEDLVWNKGNSWVYKPDLNRIKQLLLLPVGACQFVPPFSNILGEEPWRRLNHLNNQTKHQREAYVTVLHTSEDYICGAIVLAQSIIQSNSTKDLILLADENISPQSVKALQEAGWKTKRIKRIRSPFSRKDAYNEWNYSKLRIWQLKQYDKLIFIDADMLVNRNIDKFFVYPQMTAAGNYEYHLFNSGLMLVEPSDCTFNTMMKKMMVVESYNGGDQGFLNEMFTWWHRLPAQMNYLKVFVDPDDHLHWINKDVYAVHYTGLKPWKCYKERDCNWDDLNFHRYASNSAHRMWWKVYRNMPKKLRPYCDRFKNNATSPKGNLVGFKGL